MLAGGTASIPRCASVLWSTPPALEKVQAQVDDALDKGARLICGGRRLEKDGLEKGYFFAPTLLADVTDKMRIYREETFGPVAPVIAFDDNDPVLEMANDTHYGLAAYVYTRDISRAMTMMEALNFGIVGINDINPTSAAAPFGGMKDSGQGREGSPGRAPGVFGDQVGWDVGIALCLATRIEIEIAIEIDSSFFFHGPAPPLDALAKKFYIAIQAIRLSTAAKNPSISWRWGKVRKNPSGVMRRWAGSARPSGCGSRVNSGCRAKKFWITPWFSSGSVLQTE